MRVGSHTLTRVALLEETRAAVASFVRHLEYHGFAPPRLLSVSPHNIRLYEYFIRRHLGEGTALITSDELYGGRALERTKSYVLLRHDVDYTPENLHLFTEIEMKLGVRSDIYVVLDETYYDIAPYVADLKYLAKEGFVVGLHTLAPLHDDFYSELRREVDEFERLLGFVPRYFTIHGPPSVDRPSDWLRMRERFIVKIGPRMASFGFRGSPSIGGIDAWVEDSGAGGEFAYLPLAWIDRRPEMGQILGVLAHPDHWTHWPPRWRINHDEVKEHPALQQFISDARKTLGK